MKCDNAAEFVSALCDGEVIPPDAAEHIGGCAECQGRLRDYLAMGVELRRVASIEMVGNVPSRAWSRPQSGISRWWQKGWGTMRIPKMAFASMFLVIMGLAASLLVVKVRAHSDGSVVLLSVGSAGMKPIETECALSTIDKRFQFCARIGDPGVGSDKILGYQISMLGRSDGRVQLGIRTRVWPLMLGKTVSYSLADINAEPERAYWFEPGDTLNVDIPSMPALTIKGVWIDHVPSFIGAQEMDPGPEELRIISPMLLHGREVVGDLEGGTATEIKPDRAVLLYFPKQGSYLISNSQLKNGIQAQVNLNRISFDEDGQHFVFLTGTPISRSQHVWILHQAINRNHSGEDGDQPFIGGLALQQTEPGVWESKNMSN